MKKNVFAVIAAAMWISISEFFRNEILLKNYWTNHYDSLGLVFPSEPINGIIWGIWSLFLGIAIFIISRKFKLLHTVFITWLMAFVLMWVVIGNLNVLPFKILYLAVPLSLLEVYLAALIINKISEPEEEK